MAMAAVRIDGKACAAAVRAEVRQRAAEFVALRGRAPRLDVVLVGDDPASQVYVRNKEKAASAAGLAGHVHRLGADASRAEVRGLLQRLAADDTVDGMLLQLPLPKHLDRDALIEEIPPEKDVDGLTQANMRRLYAGLTGLRPCTPLGCMRLLADQALPLAGSRALVVGRSLLVGKPMAMMLLEAGCTVTIAHSRSRDLQGLVREAEIVVAAAGQPDLLRGAWFDPGATVLDVGIHRRPDGRLGGDVVFVEAVERVAALTPVPGGVGPMTIAMLLQNTVDAACARTAGNAAKAPQH